MPPLTDGPPEKPGQKRKGTPKRGRKLSLKKQARRDAQSAEKKIPPRQSAEVIVLSSGSDEAPSSPTKELPSASLDRLTDFQSDNGQRRHIIFSKLQQKPEESESDASLSDGEIRDTPRPLTETKEPPRPLSASANDVGAASVRQTDIRNNVSVPQKTSNGQIKAKDVSQLKIGNSVVGNGKPKGGSVKSGKASSDKDSDSGRSGKSGDNAISLTIAANTKLDEEFPLVQVTFLNSYLAQKYDSVFRKLIAGIMTREKPNIEKIRAGSIGQTPTSITYHECFEIDANAGGGEETADKSEEADQGFYGLEDESIPVLEEKKAEPVALTPQMPARRPKECFNCGGDHNLTGCKSPMDYAAITKRRTQFFNANSSPITGANRYHDATSDEDIVRPGEFPDCVPGRISSELQKALGLDKTDLPPWIMKMRSCGYPPGHIRSCVVESSGLDFIHDPGTVEQKVDGIRYDLSKLPVFPGFSGPFTRDVAKGPYARRYGQPLQIQSNETVISFLQELAVKRSVAARSPSPETTVDMDLADDSAVPKFYESTVPASPDLPAEVADVAENRVDDAPTKISAPSQNIMETPQCSKETACSSETSVPLVHGASLPSVLLKEEKFEMVEVVMASRPHESVKTMLLKTSSVPDLGSFSGVTDLPLNEKFAQGLVPWPFEEETQSTGRYSAIRNALKPLLGMRKDRESEKAKNKNN